MARTFTKIPTDTFETLQLNAGILVDSFVPSTKVYGNILGATSGGVNFTDTPSFQDWGEDIDNAPKNTKELKIIESREVKMSGTFATVSASTAKVLMGAADADSQDATHIIPRDELVSTDFNDIWWVGDYGENGFIAIHLINALSTTGFQIQSGDKAKGQFAFEFTGHYSMDAQDTVPYEVYVEQGESTATPEVNLNKHAVTIVDGSTATLTATTKPASQTITWTSGSSSVATVSSNGVITAEGAGSTIVTASITVEGVTYTDTCTVIVEAAE